jgi:Protein of unknown function (DUF2877)
VPATTVPVSTIGWRARAALERTHGHATVLATLSESIYVTADHEILWLGRTGATPHGRAALTSTLPEPGADVSLDLTAARSWRPAGTPATTLQALPGIVARTRSLAQALTPDVPADGLGALLGGAKPTSLLAGAVPAARALAQACAGDDAPAAARAAEPLIGLGPGLTPSGDDYVGGAFFARALLGGAASRNAAGWIAAAARVRALAAERTHPISAALLSDLLAGEGHGPLHDLAVALIDDAPPAVARAAARRLTALGHSSGWDILAGFIGAIVGPAGV